MTAGVYAIRNTVNGRRYVGQSGDIESRITSHVQVLNRHTSTRPAEKLSLFERDWLEHGREAFEVDVLEVVSVPNLTENSKIRESRERWYIRHTACEYNRALTIGRHCPLKINYPAEQEAAV